MFGIMGKTNETLREFRENIIELNKTASQLKQDEVKIVVRNEIESFFVSKVSGENIAK